MAALDDALTAGARAIDYLGDWFDRAGLCCSLDPEARDRLLTFEVTRGGRAVRIAASLDTLAQALGKEGLVGEVAAKIARTANAELAAPKLA